MRDLFLNSVNLAASRMKPYRGFIFLCGGPTDVRSFKPVSIRDAIHRELVKDEEIGDRIRIAEDYKDWSHEAIYRDLVSFERHLADLSSVIVLVLESPGSIAELGLFTAIEEFKKKLLVFIESTHYKDQSFIRLGPIDYLEKIYNNQAECHRWIAEDRHLIFDPGAAEQLQPDLAEAVKARAAQTTPERQFNPEKWIDGALLASDLLNLCSALTLRELRELLQQLGCNHTEQDVKQLLFLLERLGFLAMEPKGDQRFYVGMDERQHVHFAFHEKTFDALRFRSDLLEHYEKTDKKRFRAIHEARSRRRRAKSV